MPSIGSCGILSSQDPPSMASHRPDRCPQRPYYRFCYGSPRTIADNRTRLSDRRASPASASSGHTGEELRGQCSLFVSDRHASLTSHGMETA
jgi:hypothetical protein